ncbi:MAG: class A beta-lactamase-related serine hydrolase [Candidatus Solibacter sp.]|nr:class A beta-lactamase-related serine hydrolase [Candidatus Solibacter sp.]
MRPSAVLALLFAAALPAQPLQDALRARIANFQGTVSLYAKNLDTGESAGIRQADPVRTASTIKLPILLAVFDQVAAGKAKWTEPLTITARDKVSGSGIIGSELSGGVQLLLRDVVHLMIVLSDNSATNMVLERFTADAVNAYLDKIGIKTTCSMRKVRGDGTELKAAEGWSAAGKLPENQKYGLGVSTPLDMVSILEKLERGEIVSPEASKEILAILKRCHDDTGVRRRLNGVTIANKTGALDALRSEVALVYAKGGRIAMAITVDGMEKIDYGPDNAGSLLIADLARILVDGLAHR